MKTLVTILLVSSVCIGIGASILWHFLPQPESTVTDYARIGIEAGINACLTRGLPTDRRQLDATRRQARKLVEKMYPEIKFEWPELQEKETLPPECRWSNPDVPGADCIIPCSTTGFRYERRPLVVLGHWTPGYPYGNWHYVRTKYAVQ